MSVISAQAEIFTYKYFTDTRLRGYDSTPTFRNDLNLNFQNGTTKNCYSKIRTA
jgi:hypothetical protein